MNKLVLPPSGNHERGSIMVLAAGLLLTLTGFAVLATDVGRIYIVRNELQNVADSAALAGANCLTRVSSPTSTTNCIATIGTGLNWARASARAQDQLAANSADNQPMSNTGTGHTIEVGYFNLLTSTPSGGAFNTAFTPITANDKPAVRVTIRKDTGVNNGPIRMLTRVMFGGGADVPMQAQAVAVISSPSTVVPGSLIPQAINKCMFDLYWDSTTNSPKLAPSNAAVNGVPQVAGQPYRLRIGSSYHYGACDSGQWTSFAVTNNSASYARGLIENGNPTALGIGDGTYIQPGTQTSLYKDLDDKYPTPPGADLTVLVVDHATGLDGVKAALPIVAFAGFRITDVQGGSGKYVEGHFIPAMVSSGGSGIGPFYGTYTPPRIAR